ncbi:bifunctional metallophosphatase/5'-nucleotidase [Thiomicrospira sp. XS5]|uniref:NAD nucleotidase n=1 Tax=Thiomicrospira sp. XS5 TaxID=1775636 RepID=UPI00074A2795|nr:NAD nucleotidase [Thiomicrospira sp. XS5]KUJ75898.1 bifunctional metallophosphatase/5'-nucleotidase [Thiomicrospira sp. XS5]
MRLFKQRALWAILLTGSLTLSGCNDSSSSDDSDSPSASQPMDLTILHVNDHHSHLEADSIGLAVNGQDVDMALGGFPRVVAAINELESTVSSGNILKLHSGDAMTGTLYYTLFKGEADAAMMNEVCFDAFALGNHEFDSGDAGLKTFLDFLQVPGACATPTPVLAANVKPAVGTPLAPNAVDDYIKPYVIKEVGGEKVGLIGIDIKDKTQNSSSPLDSTEFLDEVSTAQAVIDELTAQGVNKIVLMTHYQYANDLTMAAQLRGVDVIVGGDSHTLLGDFEAVGLNSGGDYPTVSQDANGKTVCVVQAWEYAKVVGELKVSFDENGDVESCSGTPHLLVDAPFEVNDTVLEGAEQDTVLAGLANIANVRVQAEDAAAKTVLDTYSAEVDVLKQTKIGTSSVDLCLERIPGQGRSQICSAEETLPHGGDIQMLVAHAFREMALASDIAIQNAGGVRVDVPAGDLTIDTAYTLLPFSNTLVELTMTGDQIRRVLEDAIENATRENGSSGAYPYAAGLRWDVDLTQPFGSRVSNLEFKGKQDVEWTALNMAQRYTVVTNDYIAGGKDGYTTFEEVTGADYVDTFLDYAQSFVDYVEAQPNQTVSKLPYSEYSTQNFTTADGVFYGTRAL